MNAKYTQSFIRAIQLEIARAIGVAVVHFCLWRVVSIRFGLAIPAMAEEASAPYVSIRPKREQVCGFGLQSRYPSMPI